MFKILFFEYETIITPKKGVYAINVILNKKYYEGIANFGERPNNGIK